MKRKVLRKSGARQRAVLLSLETFLAITDMPASRRQDRGEESLKGEGRRPGPAAWQTDVRSRAAVRPR